MSKSKSKDTRSDCLSRVKDCYGNWLCNNQLYHLSDIYVKYFGIPSFRDISISPKDSYWQNCGGFVLPENPMTHCRSCEHYCNNINEYMKRKEEFIKKYNISKNRKNGK